MSGIPVPPSGPGLPAQLLRKFNTARVFFPATHLESLGTNTCVDVLGHSPCAAHTLKGTTVL